MGEPQGETHGVVVEIPGRGRLALEHVVADFNGTLAIDGALIDGVEDRLGEIARKLSITVLTADTFGTVQDAMRSLSVAVQTVATGSDKERFVSDLEDGVVTIGNGRNDAGMFRAASLAIAIMGREGMDRELLESATVIVNDVRDALDLILKPTRLVATLRE
jgi:P-type E1-E2 ATPase